jgi:glycosyltransferase involved in cell wall biosynthesis
MEINLFLLCYNESSLLPHVVKHYKKYLPSCKIIIYDNESTDNSVEVAMSLGCTVISWSSNNILDEDKQIYLRNTIWKDIKSGWIIMADMDEFLCITENDLLEEITRGTSILEIKGYDMVGESETLDLSDIDLQEIKKYVDNNFESKKLCFLREKIIDMNYGPGSHYCNPTGEINFSLNTYINKHMSILGLKFFTNKNIKRFERSIEMRKKCMAFHYKNDIEMIKKDYEYYLKNCKIL